jgi:hypothetical protein
MSIAEADIVAGHAESNGPRRVTRMLQDHANCARPGVEAAIDRALEPEIDRVLGIAEKQTAVLEDRRLVEELRYGAVGELKVNFDPSRYRLVGYPTHCGGTHSTHHSSMGITAPVRTHSSAARSVGQAQCPALMDPLTGTVRRVNSSVIRVSAGLRTLAGPC